MKMSCHWLICSLEQRRKVDQLEPLAIMKDGDMHSLELTDLLEDVDDSAVPIADLLSSTDGVISPDELILAPDGDGGDALTNTEPVAIDIASLVSPATLSTEPITTVARADPGLYGIRYVTHLPP